MGDVACTSMELVEVEILSDAVNSAVLRVPGRRFPGVVLQGDTLATLVRDLRSAVAALDSQEISNARDDVQSVLDRLVDAQSFYEASLRQHGVRLPY